MESGEMRIGLNGIFKWGTAGATAGTVAQNVDKVVFDGTAEFAEAKLRGKRLKTRKATYIDGKLTFTAYDEKDDGLIDALETAWFNGTKLALHATTEDGGKGLDADFYISIKRNEDNPDFVQYDVEANPTEELRSAVYGPTV